MSTRAPRHAAEASAFDVVATGRIGVDLYPLESDVGLADVKTFAKSLGGTATNVAVAAARLGCRTALITKVGADPFGDFLRRELQAFGVDDRWVGTDPELRTPIVFCEVHPPDDFPLLFYRQPSAPDLQLRVEDLDLDALRAATVLWTTGTGLCDEPSRGTVLCALRERDAASAGSGMRLTSVHDLDYRPAFWSSIEEARHWSRCALGYATVAVGNLEEVAVAVGERDPWRASEALLDLGVELAVVKLGPEGVLARTREQAIEVPPVRLEVVNGLGAGDGFGGALCAGLVHGWDLERTIRSANAAGAIVASRLQCAPAMPTLAEIEAQLGTTTDA
jgi:5-dehydro-2-deoxygluconokinase